MQCHCTRRRPLAAVPLLLALSLMIGCSSVPAQPVAKSVARQDAVLLGAVVRWNQCVQRHIDAEPAEPLGRALRFAQLIERRSLMACEGYRRDIAQRFPRHLEARVHATLSARERQHGGGDAALPANTSALIEAISTIIADL